MFASVFFPELHSSLFSCWWFLLRLISLHHLLLITVITHRYINSVNHPVTKPAERLHESSLCGGCQKKIFSLQTTWNQLYSINLNVYHLHISVIQSSVLHLWCKVTTPMRLSAFVWYYNIIMRTYEQYLKCKTKKSQCLLSFLLIKWSKTENGTITPTTVDIIHAEQES